MKQEICIVISGVEEIVTATLPDFVEVERAYNIAGGDLYDDPRLERWSYLAFIALKREGRASGAFSKFLNTVEDVSLVRKPKSEEGEGERDAPERGETDPTQGSSSAATPPPTP